MKLIHYAALGERCYEKRLPNGLLIRVVPKEGFARKYAFFATNYGSVDTCFTREGQKITTPNGVAHYLEHKSFDMPDGNVMQRFAQTGASPNAFTSYSMTAYYFDCTEQFEENLRLLLEFVSVPYYTQESVEKERGIIEQEIRMYEDSPDSRLFESLFEALYHHHPIRIPIAGSVESIQAITAQTLNDCHRAFYAPPNMMLCVVGDVDPALVCAVAEEVLPKEDGSASQRDYGPAEPLTPKQARVEMEMEVSMPMFSIGFKCEPPAYGPETMRWEFIGDLASDVLMGESTPLYQRLYESGLIDAGFNYGYESVRGAAMLYAGGDSRAPDTVRDAILAEVKRIERESIDPVLFARAKKSAVGHRLRDLDSFESICYRQCAYYFEGCDYFTFSQVYDEITVEDVAEFLRLTVRPEQMAMTVIYPKEEAPEVL